MNNLAMDALLQLQPHVILGEIDGDVIALNTESNQYLHLNGSGGDIIKLLNQKAPLSAAIICAKLEQLYVIDLTTCQAEVQCFLKNCLSLDLINYTEQ